MSGLSPDRPDCHSDRAHPLSQGIIIERIRVSPDSLALFGLLTATDADAMVAIC